MLYLLFLSILGYSQQIQNVKATQQGGKVLVTYDLNDQSGKPYYVKLLMSKDGGATFGNELRFVTGDVKNTKAGVGKKILWDAAQEISYYDGDAVFRVEAELKVAPMPEAIELKCGKVELLSVKGSGTKVIVDYTITANADAKAQVDKRYTRLYDTSGNEFEVTIAKFGDMQVGDWVYTKNVIADIPVKSQLVFDRIGADATNISLLKIYVYSNNGCEAGTFGYSDQASFQFRNVPISR